MFPDTSLDESFDSTADATLPPPPPPKPLLPGDLYREALEKWEYRHVGMKELYDKKEFLEAGLYSGHLNRVGSDAVSGVTSGGDVGGKSLLERLEKEKEAEKEGEDMDVDDDTHEKTTDESMNSAVAATAIVAVQKKKPFRFCMPMYYGETLLDTEEDFLLPYDLFRFVKVVGAGELAPRPLLMPLGKRKPAPFVRIKK
ncbi:hypothetical protein HDU99_005961, partial [Rhizoclosmatium hyalinum]